MSQTPLPFSRLNFDAQMLADDFPPKFTHRNKQIVHQIACPPGTRHSGQLAFTRWNAMELPAEVRPGDRQTQFELCPHYFDYKPVPADSNIVDWHLNFANYDLFSAYGGRLFAQDEMQVAEHPALGSLRVALLAAGEITFTVEDGRPTPILVMGVERRCRIAVDPNPTLGRPYGLYGNLFATASSEAIEKATEAIVPPTISNLIAIEAPSYGSGRYTRPEIEYILCTAFTGYSAARFQSIRSATGRPQVVIHTGYWGCGAYGGNRILMAFLQILAAQLASIDRLVFHTGSPADAGAFTEAVQIMDRLVGQAKDILPLSKMLTEIESMGFEWGVSDGN